MRDYGPPVRKPASPSARRKLRPWSNKRSDNRIISIDNMAIRAHSGLQSGCFLHAAKRGSGRKRRSAAVERKFAKYCSQAI